MKRRTFLRNSALAGASLSLGTLPYRGVASSMAAEPLEIHLFSKHLQFLDYEDMAIAAREMGFAGLDLTIRPGGHVEPENVERDLPRAVTAMRRQGLEPKMFTTAIDNVDDRVNRMVLDRAAQHGFRHFRTNWVRYPETGGLPEALKAFKPQMKALADFNARLNLQGAYQNHAGPYVGSSMWEVWTLIEDADPAGLGSQYDIRHATVEGGMSWPTGLRLIHPRITTIVLKDFHWAKNGEGAWYAQNVPLGQGMVDFGRYFRMLKDYGIQVPVSLHLEYELGGAQNGSKEVTMEPEKIFGAMKRDLATAQRLWEEA